MLLVHVVWFRRMICVLYIYIYIYIYTRNSCDVLEVPRAKPTEIINDDNNNNNNIV